MVSGCSEAPDKACAVSSSKVRRSFRRTFGAASAEALVGSSGCGFVGGEAAVAAGLLRRCAAREPADRHGLRASVSVGAEFVEKSLAIAGV